MDEYVAAMRPAAGKVRKIQKPEVKANKGSPGVDGMTVHDLPGHGPRFQPDIPNPSNPDPSARKQDQGVGP